MKKRIAGLLMCTCFALSACTGSTESKVESSDVKNEQEKTEVVEEKVTVEEAITETVAGVELKTEDIEFYSSADEETHVLHTTWITGSYGYSMPYEKERFSFTSENGIDSFVSIDKSSKGDALVSVKIYKDEMDASELLEEISKEAGTEVAREEKEMSSYEMVDYLYYEETDLYIDYYIYKRDDYSLVVEMRSDKEAFGGIGMDMLLCVNMLKFDE